jgi:hypothetical protein
MKCNSPMPVAARSKAWVCGRWDCWFQSRLGHWCPDLVNVVCCQRSLRRADPSFIGVLLCVWVWSGVTITLYIYKKETSITPFILNLGTRWRWLVNLTPRPLYPRKELLHPLNRRLGGPESQPGGFRDERMLLPLLRFELRLVQARSVVMILIALLQ